MICNCDYCEARKLNCHPHEIYFGINSTKAQLVRLFPDKPIHWYEKDPEWKISEEGQAWLHTHEILISETFISNKRMYNIYKKASFIEDYQI